MCGICGIVTRPGSHRTVRREDVERMRDVIFHRGPDGEGLYLEPGVGLGHRRLSIVDVARGAQPMASDDGQLQLIFNGEIYNHPQLMPQLIESGVRYHTHCDTETILRLYERHGTAMASYLRGMFAFAIWDRTRRRLFLARDRFGVKPLYYAHLEDGTLVFGSEIKAILESRVLRAALNRRAIPDALANYAPSGDETLFAGIKRLPAGHTMTWHDGRIDIEPYWDLHYRTVELNGQSDEQLIDEYRDRFREAVRMRLMSDVPLGMFLSGGIDSAAITATMSELVDDPIKTFSVAFAEREANELQYARLVSQRYRTDHHEVVVTPDEFFAALPRLVWHEDEPIAHPSSIALYFVSKLAAERVKVVLTGEGSDETLAGYNRYRVTLFNKRLGQPYEAAIPRAMRAVVRSGIDTLPRGGGLRRRLTRTFLYLPADLDTLYFDNFAVFGRRRQRELLAPALADEVRGIDPYAAAHAALDRTDAPTLLDRMLYADTKTYLHELLMKQDQMSMAASIESRVPFLDHPLVEYASSLPQRLKLRGWTTKYVLREAMKGLLPEEILSRRKMGFPVPVGAWLRGQFRPLLDEFVLSDRAAARGLFQRDAVRRLVDSHVAGHEKHDERLWMLVNWEIWQRIFLDGEAPDAIRLR
ncbi:MAG TPA: asparagine synthase (glutamine-hydrolyzing) [Gemmatimonadaceae bacterium]|nr:asparagine synthase (glutamine-hydrolyzing) [Gemmatimonadaceae bacterium]